MLLCKKMNLHRICIHSLACISGYLAWCTLYTHIPVAITHQVPITFFNLQSTDTIQAPDSATVSIATSKRQHAALELAVYIDAEKIPYDAVHYYHLQEKDFFMPHSLRIMHWYPSVIAVTKRKS